MAKLTRSKGQVHVFQYLCKEEALLVVIPASTVGSVDVGQARKPRVGAAVLVDIDKRIPYPLTVLMFC